MWQIHVQSYCDDLTPYKLVYRSTSRLAKRMLDGEKYISCDLSLCLHQFFADNLRPHER